MSDYVPNQLRGHADECDGIEEYDNRLPLWWVGLFWFTVVWGIVIFLDWHVIAPKSLASMYDREMAAAASLAPPIDVSAIEIVVNETTVAAGEPIWVANCVVCHQADGSGGIGPSLLDDEWIHGSSPEAIRDVVAHGVLEKGMPPWIAVLGPDGVANVSAYVVSIAGTSP